MINRGQKQIAQWDDIIAKTLLVINSSWRTKSKKATVGLYQEDKVENIKKILENYITTLTFYHTATSSTQEPLRGE